ncbi:putative nitroreductase family protein; putative Oxygen-insensitive NADPH nitroreductase (NfsA-like) [Bradyrhizobium sp. ORS 285]|uniref:NADPH-dependent oxidoreductase n=1 Tax=Bradyrhizobium sp. ORS 285 TaxID=115808 RepID=UPI0002407357|nr:NADPH-dependent oxidoreductase [Bradyrhizobium sp. ORS 285]CCD87889.1 putative nitroreductase family protein; Oxygen-insensitive NADPH nitroreductase (NfsA-like) [Bradyrhizobium sp. ORS 285]SMX58072.1 putative nitroreductase family protein; putative Oxygen-insensitive NADPH nitroreductase (NfsA-like) [Bradyrhizobium sp. ORS 285]
MTIIETRAPITPSDDITAALRKRYGADIPAITSGADDILGQLLAHRSIRSYRPDPVPPHTVETLVAAAQSAASSSNLQTWSVVAVEDPARKQRLSEFVGNQKHVREAPLFLVWLADLSRAERLARREGRPDDGIHFLETLFVAIIDAALAAQNAVVALEALGLGSVYIGAIRNRPQAVAEELGLPPSVLAVFGLCIGYADLAAGEDVKPRLRQSVVLHRERYAPTDEIHGIAAYDETLRAFQTSQGVAPVGWRDTVLNRLGSAKALNGRDKLAEALRALGFGLK